MKLELVSYINELTDLKRLCATIEIINQSGADIILFSGHTIGFVNDIQALRENITNTKTIAFLELKDINSAKIGNCLYSVSKGSIQQMHTYQLFTTSGEIENNEELAWLFLNEIVSHRQLKIKGLNFSILQCGELNILKNIQSKNNKVKFRFSHNKLLAKEFKQIFDSTNIFLNPIHTPMGNQGKMSKRRIYLSKDNRYYFSTSNTDRNKTNLQLKSLQYSLFNGKEVSHIQEILTSNYIVRQYEIH